MRLLFGDCLEVLTTLEADSVDTLITDPPGGIKFMGKEWDSDKGGRDQWIAWLTAVLSECYRVLKPGAMCLVWAIPRTSHWTGTAIENAGFEIRDQIFHLFGCLSEDTEILTSEGFKPYHRIALHDTVLCYNMGDDVYQWEQVQEVVTYEYADTAYRIQSDTTDQIVSRNHRCIVERGGGKVFRYAEALQQQESVPVLEDLPGLLKSLPMPESHSGKTKQDLLEGLFGHPDKPEEKGQGTYEEGRLYNFELSCLRESIRAPREVFEVYGKTHLQFPMQRCSSWRGLGETRPQRAGCLDRTERKELFREDDGPKQSSLEGRSNLSQAQGQLCQSEHQVRSLPTRVYQYGSQRRLCNGASLNGSPGNRAAVETFGSGTPYQSQRRGQSARKLYAIREQSTPQAIRASRFTCSSLATVTPVFYKGIVWCVRVPSGAFVARRNGKVFVTGNSGLPKSLDISKAIDKAEGAEREVIGPSGRHKGGVSNKFAQDEWTRKNAEMMGMFITAPATEAAKTWQGYGTALKPAAEIWWCAMKPIQGTFAANALEHGVAGLWIEGARVNYANGETPESVNKSSGKMGGMFGNGKPTNVETRGRWPANVLHDGSPEVLAEFARYGERKSGKVLPHHNHNGKEAGIYGKINGGLQFETYGDSGSVARFFYCAKASKSERTNGGKVENGHPTVKPLALCRYLARLTKTPTGGVVLDPFMGSGSIGIAALLEGRDFIGIEKDEGNYQTAVKRIEDWQERVQRHGVQMEIDE